MTGSASREAAEYRRQLREAEAERDGLRDVLHRTRQAVIGQAVNVAGLMQKMWEASGHDIATLLDDSGLIDEAKLAQAPTKTATDLGPDRPPQPLQPQPAARHRRRRSAGSKVLEQRT